MAPGYDPYRNISPYANQNSTGVAKALAEEHRLMLEADKARTLERIQQDVREMRYRVDTLDTRFNAPMRMFESHPEPSVEYSEPSTFWSDLFSDPIFEIFKRPSMRTGSFYE